MSENKSKLDNLLDISVVAELLHVSSRTVNRLINSGKGDLPAVKIGGRWKIRAEDVEKYLLKKNANSASNLQKLEIITNNRRSGSPQKKGGENQNTETISNEQAIRLDPGYADAYISKADALHSLRRYEEALAAYEQAICFNPDNIHAYKGKADALHSLQHYKEALAAYEQAIRLDPDNIHTYKGKADALHSLQHYKEALAAYEQVIHLDSNYAYAYKSKGDTLNNMERHQEALVAYEQARQLGYRG